MFLQRGTIGAFAIVATSHHSSRDAYFKCRGYFDCFWISSIRARTPAFGSLVSSMIRHDFACEIPSCAARAKSWSRGSIHVFKMTCTLCPVLCLLKNRVKFLLV